MLVGVIVRTVWRFYMRKLRAPPFPRRESVNVRFHESGASGSSDRSLGTRMRNSGCRLEITVTDTEVWIQPAILISLFNDDFDMEHRILLTAVSSAKIVVSVTSFVELAFKMPDGSTRHLKLRLRDPDAFIAALTRR